MDIFELIQHKAAEEIENNFSEVIDPYEIQVQHTKKEFKGDFTIVTFPLAKILKTKPDEIARVLGEAMKENVEVLENFEVAGGFLNLSLHDSYWIELVNQFYPEGSIPPEKDHRKEKVLVEYSSPNTNKPLHLGHIRNNLLGWSVSEILKKRGHEVIKACLFNDRGASICRTMVAWKNFANGETPDDAGKKGDHFAGDYYVRFAEELDNQVKELVVKGMDKEKATEDAPLMKQNRETLLKWEEGDEETLRVWRMINNWVYQGFEETYKRLGVDFDRYYYESETYLLGRDIVREGLQKGVFYEESDGSVWVDLQEEGLDKKLLLRSDGTSVYMTQDIGTAQLKYDEYQPEKSIYVVGNEQDYHFQVLKVILEKLGKNYAGGIFHLSYGMVDLPTGKMKSREGTVVDADDLLEEMKVNAARITRSLGKIDEMTSEEQDELFEMIGQGALKFFILRSDARKRITFSPEESIDFQGFTGPFIQYTHARICSLLRKAGFDDSDNRKLSFSSASSLEASERELVKFLLNYSSTLEAAEKNYNPAEIAHYAYHLAKLFNKFYHEHPVKDEPDESKRNFRMALSFLVKGTIKESMALLGIKVPEKM